jgi:hypothetical protein
MRLLVALFAVTVTAAYARAGKLTATLVPEKCLLSIEVGARIVYRGKPHCQNQPSEIVVAIPPSQAVRLRTMNAAFYANGSMWVEHEDELWIPLVAGKRYTVGEGYAVLGDAPPFAGKHCVIVTTARGARFDEWSVEHYGKTFGPFEVTTAATVGGEHARHRLSVASARTEVMITYAKLLPGSYQFFVDRRGRISLAYIETDFC